TGGYGHPDRNIWIFSLWHGMVAKPSPNEDANEQNPRNLRVLDEEPRDVTCFFDPILVASMCHGLIYLRNDFDGITVRQELGTDGDHLLPGFHSRDANRTFVGRAQLHFAQTSRPFAGMLLRHHHRKPTGLQGIWNDGAKGH